MNIQLPLEKHYSKPNCFDGITDNSGRMVIFDIAEGDAEYIVKSANLYPHLVKVIEDILLERDGIYECIDGKMITKQDILNRAEELLKRAK